MFNKIPCTAAPIIKFYKAYYNLRKSVFFKMEYNN